jgi:hypothetical protein
MDGPALRMGSYGKGGQWAAAVRTDEPNEGQEASRCGLGRPRA